MNRLGKILLFIFALFAFSKVIAQENAGKVFRIEDDKMILTLDLRLNVLQRYNIAKSFDIDSLAIEKAYKGATEVVSNKTTWKVKKINPNFIELYKPIESNPINHLNANDVFIVDDSWLDIGVGSAPVFAKSGINKLKQKEVFNYFNGIATFFLPSYKSAQKVYLSGNFNSWSTLQTPMHRVDSGWIAKIKLVPGKYTYKYIIDGKWKEDPNNYIRERDLNGGYNTVIYCTNYEFKLKGRQNAAKVLLAGSFNGWGFDEYRMIRTRNGWYLPIYLSEGTHSYKFIVDGEWITDPDNKDVRKDAAGNLNSFIGLGDSYLFKLNGYTNAQKVVLSGSFNNWSMNELVMNKTKTGWELLYILAPGTYEYKFIVDGTWITDPDNPQSSGSGNIKNSVVTFKPNYTFTLSKFSNAKQVVIAGSFNGWSRDGFKMYKKDGKWVYPIHLQPGKYLYKYIVDGVWFLDPDNKLWEENEYGTGNSILWIE